MELVSRAGAAMAMLLLLVTVRPMVHAAKLSYGVSRSLKTDTLYDTIK